MRVLVVDDDPSIRALLHVQLEAAGHEVTAAADGGAALEALEVSVPDAVVLDVMMPEITGWDVLARVRSNPRYDGLPVVLLSARDVHDDVRRGYEHGASLVLSKPYDGERLVVLLEALQGKRPAYAEEGGLET